MKETVQLEEPNYGVVLTDGQGVCLTNIEKGEGVFNCARRAIDCEYIEIVEPECLASRGYVLLINEEGKLQNKDLFVNCVASYLYGSQDHGDVIIGNAVLVKRDEDSLKMLTGAEAQQMSREMSMLRMEAVTAIASAFGLEPKPIPKREPSVASALRQPTSKNRQPCKNDWVER